MLQTLGAVITIGLADSVNPSTVGPALYLASGERGLTRVLEFAFGAGGVYFLGGAILTLGPGRLLMALLPNPRPPARFWIEIGIGLALSIVAWIVWVRRGHLADRNASKLEPKRKSAVVLGTSIMVVELPTAFPYFAGLLDRGRKLLTTRWPQALAVVLGLFALFLVGPDGT